MINKSFIRKHTEYCFDLTHDCIAFNASARMPISFALIPPINPTIISRKLGNRDPCMRSLYASMTMDNVSNYREEGD